MAHAYILLRKSAIQIQHIRHPHPFKLRVEQDAKPSPSPQPPHLSKPPTSQPTGHLKAKAKLTSLQHPRHLNRQMHLTIRRNRHTPPQIQPPTPPQTVSRVSNNVIPTAGACTAPARRPPAVPGSCGAAAPPAANTTRARCRTRFLDGGTVWCRARLRCMSWRSLCACARSGVLGTAGTSGRHLSSQSRPSVELVWMRKITSSRKPSLMARLNCGVDRMIGVFVFSGGCVVERPIIWRY